MTDLHVLTLYRPRSSGAGAVLATSLGRQATVRWDHALTAEANHRAAAGALVDKLAAYLPGLTLGAQTRASDDGVRRQFAATTDGGEGRG